MKLTALVTMLLLLPTYAYAQRTVDVGRAEFELGINALEHDRFDEAIQALERSRSIRDLPIVEYNLGLAYRGARRTAEAIAAFESFLAHHDSHTSDIELDEVRRAVDELRTPASSVHAGDATISPVVFLANRTNRQHVNPYTVAGYVGLGVAGIAVVGMVASLVVRQSTIDSYNLRCRGFGDPNPPAGCSEATAASSVSLDQNLAIAWGVVTGASLVASITTLVVAGRPRERNTNLTCGPSVGGVACAGSF